MEFELHWSGAAERAGTCLGLSSYQGNSSLAAENSQAQASLLVHGNSSSERRRDPKNKRSLHPDVIAEIKRRLDNGQTVSETALSASVSRESVQKVVDDRRRSRASGRK